MEKLGEKNCLSGTKVLEKSKCESACKEQNVDVDNAGGLVDGKKCFSTNNKKCRTQTNLPSNGKFNLICKRPGD